MTEVRRARPTLRHGVGIETCADLLQDLNGPVGSD
jgi:hypothetical protein